MPTVSLTPQQQATIDAANSALATAQSAYDQRKHDSDAAYVQIKKQYDTFTGYGCKYNFQDSLETQISSYGTLNPESCGWNTRCSKDKCQTFVLQWNVQYNAWRTKDLNTKNAAKVLQEAKNKLQETLDAIAKDPTVSANASIIENEIQAQKEKDKIKWLFFGLAAVVIVIGAVLVGRKLLGGTGASA